MAENTKIEWTDHTFNPWEGCSRVSEGCRFCYAEARAGRFNTVTWGPQGTRRVASESYWKQPLKWNREAEAADKRRRVFCASLADVFEDWQGPMVAMVGGQPVTLGKNYREAGSSGPKLTMDDIRRRLWELIVKTPYLDWLLLTKRPENINRMLGPRGINFYAVEGPVPYPQPNVWLGTSVENQQMADERIPLLLQTPAAIRFLSMEPLLSEVDLTRLWLPDHSGWWNCLDGRLTVKCTSDLGQEFWAETEKPLCPHIDWIIVGGESGLDARPMKLAWARSIVRQCRTVNAPCFIKQLGAAASDEVNGIAGAKLNVAEEARGLISLRLRDAKGGDMSEWPESLRVRQFPAMRPGVGKRDPNEDTTR